MIRIEIIKISLGVAVAIEGCPRLLISQPLYVFVCADEFKCPGRADTLRIGKREFISHDFDVAKGIKIRSVAQVAKRRNLLRDSAPARLPLDTRERHIRRKSEKVLERGHLRVRAHALENLWHARPRFGDFVVNAYAVG